MIEAPPAVLYPDAVEIERVVPGCGNLRVLGQQLWIGPALAGAVLGLWIDPISVHLSIAGRRLKTLPSRLSTNDIARLRAEGGAAAGPPSAMPSAGALLAGAARRPARRDCPRAATEGRWSPCSRPAHWSL